MAVIKRVLFKKLRLHKAQVLKLLVTLEPGAVPGHYIGGPGGCAYGIASGNQKHRDLITGKFTQKEFQAELTVSLIIAAPLLSPPFLVLGFPFNHYVV